MSAAAGIQWDGLDSMYDGTEYYSASRTGLQGAVSSSLDFRKLDINIALLYNGYFDSGNAAENAVVAKLNCFSPSMDFRLSLFEGFGLLGFARRAYRVPTFNDLYYPGMGSTNLKPEDSWLTDLGVEYKGQLADGYGITAKLDGFHYSLTSKITSMPDPNDPTGWTWLMYNIGKVHDNGFDASVMFSKAEGDLKFNITARYSYQNAIDKTPDSANYGKQIPYVARHTASAIANLNWKGWKSSLNYNLRSGRNDTSGEMPSWNTFDITFIKGFDIRIAELSVFLKGSNLFNERYEIVRFYQMPGRSFTAGIEFSF